MVKSYLHVSLLLMLILFFNRFFNTPTREGSAWAETRKRRLAIYAGRAVGGAYFIAVMSVPAKLLIYFCGSIRGGRDDAALYKRIIDQLKQYGEVLTEHIGDPNLMEKEKGMTINHLLCPTGPLQDILTTLTP